MSENTFEVGTKYNLLTHKYGPTYELTPECEPISSIIPHGYYSLITIYNSDPYLLAYKLVLDY